MIKPAMGNILFGYVCGLFPGFILSRGVTVAQQTLTLLVIVQSDPAQPWRHSSVVEHAAVNRAVVGSSPTAASIMPV